MQLKEFRDCLTNLSRLVHLKTLRMNNNPFTLFFSEYQHILVAKLRSLLTVDDITITEAERDVAQCVGVGDAQFWARMEEAFVARFENWNTAPGDHPADAEIDKDRRGSNLGIRRESVQSPRSLRKGSAQWDGSPTRRGSINANIKLEDKKMIEEMIGGKLPSFEEWLAQIQISRDDEHTFASCVSDILEGCAVFTMAEVNIFELFKCSKKAKRRASLSMMSGDGLISPGTEASCDVKTMLEPEATLDFVELLMMGVDRHRKSFGNVVRIFARLSLVHQLNLGQECLKGLLLLYDNGRGPDGVIEAINELIVPMARQMHYSNPVLQTILDGFSTLQRSAVLADVLRPLMNPIMLFHKSEHSNPLPAKCLMLAFEDEDNIQKALDTALLEQLTTIVRQTDLVDSKLSQEGYKANLDLVLFLLDHPLSHRQTISALRNKPNSIHTLFLDAVCAPLGQSITEGRAAMLGDIYSDMLQIMTIMAENDPESSDALANANIFERTLLDIHVQVNDPLLLGRILILLVTLLNKDHIFDAQIDKFIHGVGGGPSLLRIIMVNNHKSLYDAAMIRAMTEFEDDASIMPPISQLKCKPMLILFEAVARAIHLFNRKNEAEQLEQVNADLDKEGREMTLISLLDVPSKEVKQACFDCLATVSLDEFDASEIQRLLTCLETDSDSKKEHKIFTILKTTEIIQKLTVSGGMGAETFRAMFIPECATRLIEAIAFYSNISDAASEQLVTSQRQVCSACVATLQEIGFASELRQYLRPKTILSGFRVAIRSEDSTPAAETLLERTWPGRQLEILITCLSDLNMRRPTAFRIFHRIADCVSGCCDLVDRGGPHITTIVAARREARNYDLQRVIRQLRNLDEHEWHDWLRQSQCFLVFDGMERLLYHLVNGFLGNSKGRICEAMEREKEADDFENFVIRSAVEMESVDSRQDQFGIDLEHEEDKMWDGRSTLMSGLMAARQDVKSMDHQAFSLSRGDYLEQNLRLEDLDYDAFEERQKDRTHFRLDADVDDPAIAAFAARAKSRSAKAMFIAAKTNHNWVFDNLSEESVRLAFPLSAYLRCLWVFLELPMHAHFKNQVREFVVRTLTLRNLVSLAAEIGDPLLCNIGTKLCSVLRIALEAEHNCHMGRIDVKSLTKLEVVSKYLCQVFAFLDQHSEKHLSDTESEFYSSVRTLSEEAVLLADIIVRVAGSVDFESLSNRPEVQAKFRQVCIDRLIPKEMVVGLTNILVVDPSSRKPVHSIAASRANLEHKKVDDKFTKLELGFKQTKAVALSVLATVTHHNPATNYDIIFELNNQYVELHSSMHPQNLHNFLKLNRALRYKDSVSRFVQENSNVENPHILNMAYVLHYPSSSLDQPPSRRLLVLTSECLLLLRVPAGEIENIQECNGAYLDAPSVMAQHSYSSITRIVTGVGKQFFTIGWLRDDTKPCYEVGDIFITESYEARDSLLQTIHERSGPSREYRVEKQHDVVFLDALRSKLGVHHVPLEIIFVRGDSDEEVLEDPEGRGGVLKAGRKDHQDGKHPRLVIVSDHAIWEFRFDLTYWTIPPDGSGHGTWGDGLQDDHLVDADDAHLDGDLTLRGADEEHQALHRERMCQKQVTNNLELFSESKVVESVVQRDNFDGEKVLRDRSEAILWSRAIGHYGGRMEALAGAESATDATDKNKNQEQKEEAEYQAALVEKALVAARLKMLEPLKRINYPLLEGLAFGPVDIPDVHVEYRDRITGSQTFGIEFYDDTARDEFRSVLARVLSNSDAGSKWSRNHHWVDVDPNQKEPEGDTGILGGMFG